MRGQQEQQQDKQADASKGDQLLGTLAGVHGEPRHKQPENDHDEHPAEANQSPPVGHQGEELEAGILKKKYFKLPLTISSTSGWT